MKKILLIVAVAGLAVASCKKDKTCTCTWTVTSSTYNGVAATLPSPYTTVTEDKLTKVKSPTCVNDTRTTTQTTGTNVAVTVSSGVCELK